MIEFIPMLQLGIAAGSVALTITKSHAFEWFRNFSTNIAFLIGENFGKVVDDFVNCFYCMGHWTSLFFLVLYSGFGFSIEMLINWFAIVAVANLFSSIVYKLTS